MNNITVNLNDPLDLFNLRDPVVFHGVNGTHMLINTGNLVFKLLLNNLKLISLQICSVF